MRERKDFGSIGAPTPTITHVRDWIQHILDTTTINISASGVNSEVVIADGGDFWTPQGMFYDFQVLEDVVKCLDETGFEVCSTPRLVVWARRANIATSRYPHWAAFRLSTITLLSKILTSR